MNLLLIAHNVLRGDGQGRINFEIVKHLLSLGHEVRVVCADLDSELIRQGAVWDYVRVPRRPVLQRVRKFVRSSDQIVDRVKAEGGTDVVVANGFCTTRPHDLNLCQFVHAAWLRSDQGREIRSPCDWAYQQLFTRYNIRAEKVAYSAARLVIVPSKRTGTDLEALVGISASKIDVIPNGVDPQEFYPSTVDRRGLGLPVDVPLLLFVGDLRTNRKGIKYVLQAISRLPTVHLAVVGRAEGSSFPAFAATLGLADRVRFLGFRQDIPAVMRACDLFVFPSTYEPFGMVVTEALASGLPVITTRQTGAAEIMHGDCGTVLDNPADVSELTTAIAKWTTYQSKDAADVENRRRSVSDHTWAKMAEAYLKCIVSLQVKSGVSSNTPIASEVNRNVQEMDRL